MIFGLPKKQGLFETKELSKNDYYYIAANHNLDLKTSKDYVSFMQSRFPETDFHTTHGYASEWAERFRTGSEWQQSDNNSRQVLKEVNPEKYAGKE